MTQHSRGQTGKIRVQLDPDIQDLVPGFLENRRKDVAAIRRAVSQQDYKTITVLGHTMKGDGGGYGFDAISEFGAALETAGKEKNAARVTEAVDRLAEFLERVEVVYS